MDYCLWRVALTWGPFTDNHPQAVAHTNSPLVELPASSQMFQGNHSIQAQLSEQ